MKISTLALGALISFSIHATAQEKPKPNPEVKHTKNTKPKHLKPKHKPVLADTSNLNEPKHSPQHYCPACGRG